MATYHGSCHCGAVRYEIEADLSRVTRCTCSICTKKGALLVRVEPENLRITAGRDKLRAYQFNKKIAKHHYCGECGIHTFGNPRTAPEKFIVNVNTLDEYDIHAATPDINVFDGRNWEQAFAASQRRSAKS